MPFLTKISPAVCWRGAKLTLAATALAVAAGCASQVGSTTDGGALGVNRVQKLAGSSEQYNQESAKAYSEMMQEAKNKNLLNRDAVLLDRVRTMANRMIGHVGVFRADARNWNWEINTIQSNDINAFCMPGGKMAVFSGLPTQLKLTDDELAIVIGHEIAHALREHGREQALKEQQIGLLSVLVGVALKSEEAMKTANQVGQIGYGLKYSRGAESEADMLGLELAARAGYDPRAGVTLWQKMGAAGGARPLEFLSTHPDPANRQAALKEAAEKLLPVYQAAPKPAAAKASAATPAKKASSNTRRKR